MPTMEEVLANQEELRKRYNLDSPMTQVLAGKVRDTVTFPQRLMQTIQQNPVGLGLSRSDYTDIPDERYNQDSPITRAMAGTEPVNPSVGMATDLAINMVGGFIPTAEKGAAGIFGGRLAATADKAKLAQAEKMATEGASREDIWNKTGWFRGIDGNWRFEIDDSLSTVTPTASQNLRAPHGFDAGKPEGIFWHDQLYEAYPGVRDYSMTVERKPSSSGAEYTKTKHIDASGPDPVSVREVLLHELQHAVQAKEGFAAGGNPLTAQQFTKASAETELSSLRRSRDYLQKRIEDFVDFPYQREQLGHRLAQVDNEIANLTAKIPNMPQTGHEAYWRLGGEVEARNVSTRQDMTPAERAATPPWLMEGVPPKDQIITFDNPTLGSGSTDKRTAAMVQALQAPKERLGRSDEANDLRRAMELYGRDNKTLRDVWQKHGPERDWLELPEKPWNNVVSEWNAQRPGQQVNPERYQLGTYPEFEKFVEAKFPTRRQPFPGKMNALEWLVQNDPLGHLD